MNFEREFLDSLLGTISPAEHALNVNPAGSQFLSASGRPFGADDQW